MLFSDKSDIFFWTYTADKHKQTFWIPEMCHIMSKKKFLFTYSIEHSIDCHLDFKILASINDHRMLFMNIEQYDCRIHNLSLKAQFLANDFALLLFLFIQCQNRQRNRQVLIDFIQPSESMSHGNQEIVKPMSVNGHKDNDWLFNQHTRHYSVIFSTPIWQFFFLTFRPVILRMFTNFNNQMWYRATHFRCVMPLFRTQNILATVTIRFVKRKKKRPNESTMRSKWYVEFVTYLVAL